MSVAYPIFPGFKPGQGWTAPPTPVRSPTWNYKETKRWLNFPQTAVSGKTTVTKYWSNPLRNFEWKYGYIDDDPTGNAYGLRRNQFYTSPIPNSDFEMLESFYDGMQASGNQFAYTPPGSQTGGTWPVTAISITGSVVTFTATGAGTALASNIGRAVQAFNTGVAAINGKYLYIVSTSGANTVVCFSTVGSGTATAGGIITLGQVLAAPDTNDNVELTYTSGSYPTISGQSYGGSVVSITESVQLIDTSTLIVYDGAGTNINGNYTLAVPNSITPPLAFAPYVGYVLEFGTYTPAALPLTASYNLYYICRFSEDTQEYENFMAMLWMSTIKFQQDRL